LSVIHAGNAQPDRLQLVAPPTRGEILLRNPLRVGV